MFKKATEKARKFLERPVSKAFGALGGLFGGRDDDRNGSERGVLALIRAVMPPGGVEFERVLEQFSAILEEQHCGQRQIQEIRDFLQNCAPGTPEDAWPALRGYSRSRQADFLKFLTLLALEEDGGSSEKFAVVSATGLGLGFSDAEMKQLEDEARSEYFRRAKLFKSGTGIILALIVIAVFILVATWLSSVLFGLALAYIFLPLEHYFERKLSAPPTLVGRIGRGLGRVIFPLAAVRRYFTRKNRAELTEIEQRRREQRVLTAKATTLTVSTVVTGGLILLVVILIAAGSYFAALRSNISNWVSTHRPQEPVAAKLAGTGIAVPTVPGAAVSAVTAEPEALRGKDEVNGLIQGVSNELIDFLNHLKQRFQELPLISSIITELADYLDEGKAQRQLTELLFRKSGGLFAFVTAFVTVFAKILLNLLLTVFFFSLFLSKLAGFTNDSANAGLGPSSYLIRTVFNGKWLPRMSQSNIEAGDRIVSEVINKLRIWLRGYLAMIAIDFCVYGTFFHLLDVPYALILAAVAAVGILLPYIGPVSSALLTVLVTLAAGGASVTALQIAGIIAVYLIHNGVIEQFFIYPWIIGESLGLSTLETIIVVLLGGILAGIPGMIFALPAAAVIKYLVPQIYRCWD